MGEPARDGPTLIRVGMEKNAQLGRRVCAGIAQEKAKAVEQAERLPANRRWLPRPLAPNAVRHGRGSGDRQSPRGPWSGCGLVDTRWFDATGRRSHAR